MYERMGPCALVPMGPWAHDLHGMTDFQQIRSQRLSFEGNNIRGYQGFRHEKGAEMQTARQGGIGFDSGS